MNNTMRTVCNHFLMTACFLTSDVFPRGAAQVAAPPWLRSSAIFPRRDVHV